VTATLEPIYPIESSRLALRPLRPGDAAQMTAYRALAEVCRYVPFEPMGQKAMLDRIQGAWNRTHLDTEGQAVVLGVELRSTRALIGDVTLIWASERHRRAEIGYVLNPKYRGHGFATEAAHRLLHLVFDELAFHRVVARIVVGNDPSVRVAMRLGLRQEAHFREHEWFKGRWIDQLDFALLDSEWRSLHAPGTRVIDGCHLGPK
jgi:RimJ/RimL family protein N-acetyltransferase